MAWKFETVGPDGQCKLFGVNIFDYDWQTKIAVFSGNVQINQGGNTSTTECISYDVKNNKIL